MSVTVGQIGLNMVLNGNQFKSQLNNLQSKAQLASNKMSGSFKRLGIVIAAAFSVAKIKKFGQESIKLANEQTQAEVKLQTIMKQRMKATDAAVKKIKDYAGAQQKIGVIGDEVQLAGAQQLSTFLNTDKALKTLIPAMNNLAVQQNGVNAGASDLVNIGNLMGKAMQGQTSALTRVGITFTEAQEKVLKYGNEQERAAMLAQVITDNVGDMNRAIAATPAGKLQQIKNTWGDIKETVGRGLNNTFKPLLNLINKIIQRLAVLSSAFEKFTAGLFGDANDTLSSLATTANDIGAVGDEADASAESIDSITKSAEKAERSLAGFDKLNVLSKPYTSAQYDTPKVSATESPINKTTNSAVKKLSDVISSMWDSKSQKIINSIKNALSSIKTAIGSIKTAWKNVWNNGSGKKLLNNIKSLLTHIFENIGYIAKAFNNAWNKAGRGEGVVQSIIDKANSLIELIDTIAQDFKEVWNNGTGERIWGNILEIIKNCNFYTAKFREKIKKAWEKNDTGKKLWQDILGIIEDITGWLKDMSEINLDWIENLDLSPLVESVEGLASAFRELLKACGQKLKDVYQQILLPLAKWTIEKGVPKLVELFGKALQSVAKVIKSISPTTLKNVAAAIAAVYTAIVVFKAGVAIAAGIDKIRGALGALLSTLESNPYAAIVAGIAAAIVGLVAAIKSANKTKLKDLGFEEATEKMDGYLDKIQECKGNIDQMCDDINKSLDDTATDLGVIDDYKNRLDELLNKATLTDSEQNELTTIGDYFSKKYPEFEDAWNKYITKDENGKINLKGNVDEIITSLDSLIDKYRQTAAQAALTALAQENMQNSIAAKTEVNSAAVSYQKAVKELQDFRDEWNLTSENLKEIQTGPGFYTWQNKNSTKNADYSTLKKQYEELSEKVRSARGSYNETANSAAQLAKNNDDLAKMQAVVNGNYDDAAAVLMAYNAGLINTEQIETSQYKNLENLQKEAAKTNEDTIFGMSNGLQVYAQQIKDEGNKAAELYLNGYDEGMDINSPSKEMYKRGVWTVQGLINAFNGMKSSLSDPIKNIVTEIEKKLSPIKSVFSNAFSAIWDTVKPILNSLMGHLEKFINGFISGINWLLDGVDTIVGGIGDLFGQDWHVGKLNEVSLPRFAKGAVVKAPTLAVVGDNPGASTGDPEVVAPLSKLEQMWANKSGGNTGGDQGLLNMLTRIYELLVLFRRESNSKDDTPVVNVDGRTLFDIMVKQNNDYKNRHGGYSLFGG